MSFQNNPDSQMAQMDGFQQQKGHVAFITLGCKVNSAETEGMKALFEAAGYQVVEPEAPADVCVINTCTVTHTGDRKSRQMIRRFRSRNPDAIVAAVGCYVQVAAEEVAAIQGIDLVLGNNRKHLIVEKVEAIRSTRQAAPTRMEADTRHILAEDGPSHGTMDVPARRDMVEFEVLPAAEWKGQTRAFLKIQDGCDQFCSYCIIPYARGPVRSRRIPDALAEAEQLLAAGYTEFVLTGIHLASFKDDAGSEGLLTLVKALQDMEGLRRIRFGSLEPGSMTPAFLDALARYPKLCPHFHISLQSGSEGVLRRMNRKYAPQEFLRMLGDIRARFSEVSITTDVMVGFPGETDAEFAESLAFCGEAAFSWMHVFPFSPRKGTPAARLGSQVSSARKAVRAEAMGALAISLREAFQQTMVGRTTEILLEHADPEAPGHLAGFTPNYVQVSVPASPELAGRYVWVVPETPAGESMHGRLLPETPAGESMHGILVHPG